MEPKILKKIFDKLQNETYCVIKLEEKSLGKMGGDIDIYCNDISKIGKKILHIGNSLLNENVYDDIKLTENKELKHAYIDFYKNKELSFRFDLFGKFPYFKSIEVKKELFNSCLINKVEKTIVSENNKFSIFVPEETFDLLLRYIEFIEYYPERQDKIKHLKYIANVLTDENKRFSFLSYLANYVLKVRPKKDKPLSGIFGLMHFSKRVLRKIKSIILNH